MVNLWQLTKKHMSLIVVIFHLWQKLEDEFLPIQLVGDASHTGVTPAIVSWC
jgi:hypothetical protein